MKAMYGSSRFGVGHCSRLLGCVAALAALSAMATPSIAAAKTPKINKTYVALGDSLAFGYSQQGFNENLPTENPAAFEKGYANDYLGRLNEGSQKLFQLVDYGCPGETTESLIGDNPTFIKELNEKAKKAVAEPITGEAPCAYHYQDGFPLHNEYGGKSQLEAVLATINEERAAGKRVKVISLDIGANDELHEVAKAEKEAETQIAAKVAKIVTPEAEAEVGAKVEQIVKEEVEAYVVEQVIPQALGESGGIPPAFEEDIAKDAGEYFATHAAALESLGFRYLGEYFVAHAKELNEEGEKIGEELGAAYAAAHAAELHAEGETIALGLIKAALPAVYAQIDTNVVGILIAIRDDRYKGKIIFEGTYDPYGRVKYVSKEHDELEPGFNAAAAELVGLEEGTFATNPKLANVCYSDPETLFNPALAIPDKESYDSGELALVEKEEEDLADWTNMANFNTFEYAVGKVLHYGEKVKVGALTLSADGPDIHATTTGYEEMAKQMGETCPF